MNGINNTNIPSHRIVTAFQSALSANLEYASSLRKQLNELRNELFLNLEKQRLLKAQKQEKTWLSYSSKRRCAMVRRGKFFSVPHCIYFIHKIKRSKMNEYKVKEPNINIDTKHWLKKSLISLPPNTNAKQSGFKEYVPVFNVSKNVSKMEKNIIISSARCEYIEKAKMSLIHHNNNNNNRSIDSQNRLRNRLMRLDECAPIDIDGSILDWKRISRYLIGKHVSSLSDDIHLVKHRFAAEYERIWNNYILCDTASFSKIEINCLRDIVLKYRGYNWIAIHKEFNEMNRMNRNRSMLSLIGYYQQNLNTIHTKHDWTRSDDEILIYTAKVYGERDQLSQSYYLDRRLPHQCYSRLQHATGTDKNIWTKMEELMLLLLIKSQRNIKWSKVKLFIMTKSDGQCRDRYQNHLKNVIKKDSALNLVEIIFICELLCGDKHRLWAKWSDISYVTNWFIYNDWNNKYKKCKKKLKNIQNIAKKKRYSQKLMQIKKEYITNHKYHDPSSISYLFCILFGGKEGNKLFDNEHYATQLLQQFNNLKDLAIQCQKEKHNHKYRKHLLCEINHEKNNITQLINHEKFKFDQLIQDIVHNTVYLDDDIHDIHSILS